MTDLDPTKLKGRQFSRGTVAPVNSKNDMSLWTETPAERQQRLADEVSGKKRRVADAPVEDMDEKARKKRRKEEEEAIRKGVDEHTVSIFPILLIRHSVKSTYTYHAAQKAGSSFGRPACGWLEEARGVGGAWYLGPLARYGSGWQADGR